MQIDKIQEYLGKVVGVGPEFFLAINMFASKLGSTLEVWFQNGHFHSIQILLNDKFQALSRAWAGHVHNTQQLLQFSNKILHVYIFIYHHFFQQPPFRDGFGAL